MKRSRWLDDLRVDSRFALRLLKQHRSFSTNVIGIAALGMTVCVATFSVVSGILISPLPFDHPERVAMVLLHAGADTTASLPFDTFAGIGAASGVIDAIASETPDRSTLIYNGEPQEVATEVVSPSFFRVYGISPALGRPFVPDDAAHSAPVVLLGNAAWRTRFGADSGIVGRVIAVDDVPHTVIGVMPPRFRAHYAREPFLWRVSLVRPGIPGGINAVVRLADGVRASSATAWLAQAVQARIAGARPGDSVAAIPLLAPITEWTFGYAKRPLMVLLGAVLFVLAMVATNVATLFLSRSSARDGELRIRRALGASQGRELRQLVTEAMVLTGMGGAVGIVASYWVIALVRRLGASVLPRMDAVVMDWRVLLFAAAAIVVTGVAGGLAPALVWRRGTTALGDAAITRVSGRHRASSALVVAQIALSVLLLVGAGLLVKGFLRVLPTHPGFAAENRATLSVRIGPGGGYAPAESEVPRRFVRDVSEQLRRVPGVVDVAANAFLPFTGNAATAQLELAGHEDEFPRHAFNNFITPNYFDVMQMPMHRGRAFTAADRIGSESVVIVNETAAASWWPSEDPVGQRVRFTAEKQPYTATVVGIVGDIRTWGLDTRVRPEVYVPLAQASSRIVSLVVQTAGDPRAIMPRLQRAVWSVEPRLPIETGDLTSIAFAAVSSPRFFSIAMGLFAGISLLLSAAGVYGLLAFAVEQRRREIGIRIALGAPSRRIGRMVLGRALFVGTFGSAAGLLLSLWLTRYMGSVLTEVTATDATIFAMVTVTVLGVSVIAACAPAYHALRVDPVETLKA